MSENENMVPAVEDSKPTPPEMPEFYNKHYIRTREDGCIIDGWSDGPNYMRTPTEDDILYNEHGSYQFCLIIDGEPTDMNPQLTEFETRIPFYRWDGKNVIKRTDEELLPERKAYEEEFNRKARLDTLHHNLQDTDYIDNKIVEALMTNGMEAAQEMADHYSDAITQRQEWRDDIKELEK